MTSVGENPTYFRTFATDRKQVDFGREKGVFPLVLIQVKSAANGCFLGLKNKRKKAFLPFKTQLFHIQVVRCAASRSKPKVSATYKISSDISYSFTDIANILSAISEMPICYSPVERSFFRKSLLNDSIPITWTDRIVSVAKSIEMNEFDLPDFTLFRLLERAKKEQEKISKRSLSYWLGREQERVHTGKNKNLSDYLKEVYLS